MMKGILVFALCSALCSVQAQDYAPFQNKTRALIDLGKVTNPDQQREAQRMLLDSLKRADQIPITYKDSVAFIYVGKATAVEWMGDFNGWGYDKGFVNAGKKIPGTDIWILKASFPTDARLDYKIVLNKKSWILDPLNLHQQWSGVGGGSPNSELRMPEYHDEVYQKERQDVPKGIVEKDILFTSHMLGYQITYSVYVPANKPSGKLPVIYVTDGYEYLHPQLGNMPVVLDNLIADQKIEPLMAVFIDHREPANRTNNRRMQELVMNEDYLTFFTDEFIPFIELNYPASKDRAKRAVIGSSVGGLSATYFAFSRPDIFGNAGIQSPSFFTRPQIYSLCDTPEGSKLKISMTSGLINDASDSGRKMIKILENNSCVYQYREVNQGHSWGNWRNLVDDILVDFFAPQP